MLAADGCVPCSRVRSLDGLQLVGGINTRALAVDPAVVALYKSLEASSGKQLAKAGYAKHSQIEHSRLSWGHRLQSGVSAGSNKAHLPVRELLRCLGRPGQAS